MKEIIDEAIAIVSHAPYALLITVDIDDRPSVREIGPFINDGLNVCFTTRLDSQKVRQFRAHPIVTLYFPNTNPDSNQFKTVAISGRICRVTDETERFHILDRLGEKSPFYRKKFDKEWFEDWAIYKLTSDALQFTDITNPTRTVKIKL